MRVDRRMGRRVATEHPVVLLWRDQSGQMQESTFRLANISISGATVRAERPICVGTTVSLGHQSETIVGKVKHCVRRGADFMLGIEFENDCEWAIPRNPQ